MWMMLQGSAESQFFRDKTLALQNRQTRGGCRRQKPRVRDSPNSSAFARSGHTECRTQTGADQTARGPAESANLAVRQSRLQPSPGPFQTQDSQSPFLNP